MMIWHYSRMFWIAISVADVDMTGITTFVYVLLQSLLLVRTRVLRAMALSPVGHSWSMVSWV